MKIKTALLSALLSVVAFAQVPSLTSPPVVTFIKGDLGIKFNTRTQLDGDKPKAGVADVYTLNVNVSNSARFQGTIEHKPTIKGMVGISQPGQIAYAINLDVVNPNNPAQTRNIGNLYGTVPIDPQNIYHFEFGEPKVSVFGAGSAKGFDSKFTGQAAGKPPADSGGMLDRLKKEALSITKNIGGKTVALTVTKYDKMEFKGHVLAAGPVQIYSEVTINGGFVYDYARTAWFFEGVTATYSVDGSLRADKISGNIRWDSARSEYQFDIRINEKLATEASVFSGTTSEADFFAVDSTVESLTGTMKYKDTTSGEITTSSAVTVDLVGNKLTKQQTMYLCKLLFLSSIVPLNSD